GILYEDDFAGGLCQSSANACSFALVPVMQGELDGVGAVVSQHVFEIGLLQEFTRPVGGAIVHDDEFFSQSDRLLGHLIEELHHGLPLVEDRNDDGQRVELRDTQ